jgi:hypothetical protein
MRQGEQEATPCAHVKGRFGLYAGATGTKVFGEGLIRSFIKVTVFNRQLQRNTNLSSCVDAHNFFNSYNFNRLYGISPCGNVAKRTEL